MSVQDLTTLSDEDFMQQVDATLSAEEPGSSVSDEDVSQDDTVDSAAPDAGALDLDSSDDTTLEDSLNAAAEDVSQDTDEGAAKSTDDDSNTNTGDDDEAAKTEAAKETDPASPDKKSTDAENSDSREDGHTTPKQTTDKAENAESGDDQSNSDSGEQEESTGSDESQIDYKTEYNRIMAPFKANGRQFHLNSPDEAIRLMQMGANYNKKMQGLKPALKVVKMLESNNLLDTDKISFLIDLEKKNPQAIQKLLHESQIDPMDIDTTSEPAYQPGNYAVSDQEMAFHDALGDVTSTPTGKDTVSLINSQWDQPSKEAIYQDPNILRIINDQRANGIYDAITAEMDRQMMLGMLDAGTPFIMAYKQVGDTLHNAGKLVPTGSTAQDNPGSENQGQEEPSNPVVVDTRTAPRRKPVTNSDKARAAAPARSAPKTAPNSPNPLTMTDDEIMAAVPF